MKKKLVIVAVIALVVLLLAFYLRMPGSAPPNQKPLVVLTPANIAQFTAAFDADVNVPRFVLLLSPT